MKRQIVLLLVGVTLPLGALIAADGAIPIWEPTTITEPGKYVVTRSIQGPLSAPVLSIEASNVVVDLNGFTLRNDGDAPVVLAEDVDDIVLKHGNVVQGGSTDAVRFRRVRGLSIRHLLITKPPSGYNETGIYLEDCDSGTVEHNIVRGGFEVSLVTTGRGIAIRHNVLSNTDCEAGVSLSGTYSTFSDNLLENCSRLVVSGEGHRIINNDIRAASSWESSIRVYGSRNRIVGNTLIDNPTQFGLRFEQVSSDNYYSDNVASGNNGNVEYCDNPSATADFCDEGTNNTSHGDNYMPGKM